MFTLDIKKILKNAVICYIFVTIFCILFNLIYSKFSHGISSLNMQFVFLIPLICGVLGFYFLYKKEIYNRIFFNLYNAGISTLIVGNILKGILYIAGNDEIYYKYYVLTGIVLILISIIIIFITNMNNFFVTKQ